MSDMPRVVGGSSLLKGGARETNTTNENDYHSQSSACGVCLYALLSECTCGIVCCEIVLWYL